jgi:hypothetical protein
MAYNNPNPAQSTTLTANERAREARRILEMLREEDQEKVERVLTSKALGFVQSKWMEMELGGSLEGISENAYWWLQDIWSRFA